MNQYNIRMQKSFSSVTGPFLILLLSCILSSFVPATYSQTATSQPIRTVAVSMAKVRQDGLVKVYFTCPDIRSRKEWIKFYQIDKTTGKQRLIKEDKNGYGILVEVTGDKDLGRYGCDVVTEDGGTRTAIMKIINSDVTQGPQTLKYSTANVRYVVGNVGKSVELKCDLTGSPISWYRPAQFQILAGSSNLKIDKVSRFDYGAYYCVEGVTEKDNLNGQKIILVDKIPDDKEISIDQEVEYVQHIIPKTTGLRHRPNQLQDRVDNVVWERPPGSVLLNHGRDFYKEKFAQDLTITPFYYRITRNGDLAVNKVGKLIIANATKSEVEVSIQGRVAYGENVKIECFPSPEMPKDAEVVWLKDKKIIHRGNTLSITKFDKQHFTDYRCEIRQKGSDFALKTRDVSLKSKKARLSQVEMQEGTGEYYLYHKGTKKELHCELEKDSSGRPMPSRNVVWTLNGRKIMVGDPKSAFGDISRFNRLDRMFVSILVLSDMDLDNEGVYKCFQKNKAFTANLVMEQPKINVGLSPKRRQAIHNNNDVAEFHCRIDSNTYNSSYIKWSFIPEKSKDIAREEPLPKEVIESRPTATSSTSFIGINNVLKRHEGLYVCRVFKQKLLAQLVVIQNAELVVSPKVITIKPGNTARYLCQLKNAEGAVTWRRKDRKSFKVNKENRLGGSTNSILEVKDVTTADHGTEYECFYKNLVETVILYVKEECPLNERKCKNGTCIDENKFCDGKNDCGDNSDEDPKRCNECSPNSIHCDFIPGVVSPTRRCVVKHWKCDGVDDCGNNFDELNCTIKNKDKCLGTHYMCNNNATISRSYWCDGETDCESGDDEEGCSKPQVIEPKEMYQVSVFNGSRLELTCRVSGRPTVTITWRYNWGYLPDSLNHTIKETVENCSVVTSTIIIDNINPDESGIYSCEAIARRRVMAPDYAVSVVKKPLCKAPYFNNEAPVESFCLRCFCSNVTDQCTSAVGYSRSKEPLETKVKASDATIINAKTGKYNQDANQADFIEKNKGVYYISDVQYKSYIKSDDEFFGGLFNMPGSWIMRYGYPMTFKIKVNGNGKGKVDGPLVVLNGKNDNFIYYCPPKYKIWVHPSKDDFENELKVVMWERDYWYNDYSCTEKVTRDDFMKILVNMKLLLFRIKFYSDQTNFQMTKVLFNYAKPSPNKYSWATLIEQCKCPPGYKGMSCEEKTG